MEALECMQLSAYNSYINLQNLKALLQWRRSRGWPQIEALECMQLSADGELLACCSSDGVLSLLEAGRLAQAQGTPTMYVTVYVRFTSLHPRRIIWTPVGAAAKLSSESRQGMRRMCVASVIGCR